MNEHNFEISKLSVADAPMKKRIENLVLLPLIAIIKSVLLPYMGKY